MNGFRTVSFSCCKVLYASLYALFFFDYLPFSLENWVRSWTRFVFSRYVFIFKLQLLRFKNQSRVEHFAQILWSTWSTMISVDFNACARLTICSRRANEKKTGFQVKVVCMQDKAVQAKLNYERSWLIFKNLIRGHSNFQIRNFFRPNLIYLFFCVERTLTIRSI